MVLQTPRHNELYAKFSKCSFYHKLIHYLGHVISEEGIVVDPKNIKEIMQCPTPKIVEEVRCFMGITCYYRIFIK